MNEIINQQRQIIDDVDKEIVDLLCRRFDAALEIGRQKREIGAKVLDLSRELKILDARGEYAESRGLNPDFVKRLIQQIMDESKQLQEQIN